MAVAALYGSPSYLHPCHDRLLEALPQPLKQVQGRNLRFRGSVILVLKHAEGHAGEVYMLDLLLGDLATTRSG